MSAWPAEAIAAAGAAFLPPAGPEGLPAAGSATSFADRVSQGLAQVNGRLIASQVELQQLAVGEPVSLHRVMIGLEESRLSLQLMLQVRARLLEAYQDLMRMPL